MKIAGIKSYAAPVCSKNATNNKACSKAPVNSSPKLDTVSFGIFVGEDTEEVKKRSYKLLKVFFNVYGKSCKLEKTWPEDVFEILDKDPDVILKPGGVGSKINVSFSDSYLFDKNSVKYSKEGNELKDDFWKRIHECRWNNRQARSELVSQEERDKAEMLLEVGYESFDENDEKYKETIRKMNTLNVYNCMDMGLIGAAADDMVEFKEIGYENLSPLEKTYRRHVEKPDLPVVVEDYDPKKAAEENYRKTQEALKKQAEDRAWFLTMW